MVLGACEDLDFGELVFSQFCYLVDSIGRRNTLTTEVFGGEERLDCEDRRCAPEGSSAVAGITSAEATIAVGVSVPVGVRWFRHAGGMLLLNLAAICRLKSVRRSR